MRGSSLNTQAHEDHQGEIMSDNPLLCPRCQAELMRCGRCDHPKCECPDVKAVHGPGKCGTGT
jgi:hypothetical protein